MPRNDNKTDFSFRRAQLDATSNVFFPGAGNIEVVAPAGLRRRRIYYGVNWQGFTDWWAISNLDLMRGNDLIRRFRIRWGNFYVSQVSTTLGNDSGTIGIEAGIPSFSVEDYDPTAVPNGPASPGSADSIRLISLTKLGPSLVTMGTCMTMYPWEWYGDVQRVRHTWEQIGSSAGATPSVVANAFVEVYVGIKSMED